MSPEPCSALTIQMWYTLHKLSHFYMSLRMPK